MLRRRGSFQKGVLWCGAIVCGASLLLFGVVLVPITPMLPEGRLKEWAKRHGFG